MKETKDDIQLHRTREKKEKMTNKRRIREVNMKKTDENEEGHDDKIQENGKREKL